MLRLEHLLAVRALDFDAAAFEEPPVTLERRDARRLEQRLDPGGQLPHDRALALEHLADVHRERAYADAVRGKLRLRAMVELGRFEQRLRRDAADVQARAAERIAAVRRRPFVDASSLEAELSRSYRRGIAGRSAADHDDVEFLVCHYATRFAG